MGKSIFLGFGIILLLAGLTVGFPNIFYETEFYGEVNMSGQNITNASWIITDILNSSLLSDGSNSITVSQIVAWLTNSSWIATGSKLGNNSPEIMTVVNSTAINNTPGIETTNLTVTEQVLGNLDMNLNNITNVTTMNGVFWNVTVEGTNVILGIII